MTSRTRALAAALRARVCLAPGDVAFVLAPAGVHVPVLYYALMAVGAVVSLAQVRFTAASSCFSILVQILSLLVHTN